ncbi:B12-binding domain-containing radical SAM protein, partial [Candidatus Woesearchaeota archaeon]|nr:B12-binding domain-containing radical SAM protein [Candidatus Woesearchaeota archaeon]
HADYVVRGEGEHTLVELVNALQGDGNLENIRGLSYKEGDKIIHDPDRPLETNLDKIPFADIKSIAGYEKLKILPIATSRGCPHDCDFCSVVPMFGRGYRRRSNEKIIDELENLLEISNRIFFVDDNFAGRKKEAKELLYMMKDRGLGKRMKWYAQVTVHAAKDDELLDLMKDTNCSHVYIGFESVNHDTLKNFNKGHQNLDDMKYAIEMFHKRGIRVHGMFVLGSDEDDVKTIESTVKFAKEQGLDTVQFAILTPLPGTRTYDLVADSIFTKDWGLYDSFHVVHEPAKMSRYELQKGVLEAWKEFYSPPRYVWAFMQFKITTGKLRFYGHQIVKKSSKGLQDYLKKLRHLEPHPQH